MKFTNSLLTSLYTTVGALLLTLSSFAQAPEQMSYQAIVRNATGNLVTNQLVGMQISILQTTATGIAVYVETHTETTNANGLLTLQVGAGSLQNGTFATIDWSDTYFIKTETDLTGGTSYTIIGTSQLLSVPYALHAKTVRQPTYTVNNFYAELGGYVIQISPNGKHGLVVAMQDQGYSKWHEAHDLLSNASNHDADGKEFSDWRIPTKRELNLMYEQRATVGNFGNDYYWSSSNYDYATAWLQNFTNGNQNVAYEFGSDYSVRAVRAF